MVWMTIRTTLVLAALAAGPVTAAQDVNAPPAVERPGDDKLTCEQLQTEMRGLEAEFLAMNKQVEKVAMQQTAGAAGKQKAGTLAKQALSGLASTLIPGAGGLIGMGLGGVSGPTLGNGDRAAAMMKAMQPLIDRQTVMSERMQRVGTLQAQKCAADGSVAPR